MVFGPSILASWRFGFRFSSKLHCRAFGTTAIRFVNPRINLDSSFQTLLQDVDISVKKYRLDSKETHRELEIISEESLSVADEFSPEEWTTFDDKELDFDEDNGKRENRKSPAASFGSKQLGSVSLPEELQATINLLVNGSSKEDLHNDAVRLFQTSSPDSEDENNWNSQYDQDYRSKQQANRHRVRDGTAFATIALPAHFSAITSVLHHAKLRLDPSWEIERIIDWGAATGSGLWASLYSFQGISNDGSRGAKAASSKILSYLGVDKRDGLVSIGKKLISDTVMGDVKIRWKRSFRDDDKVLNEDGRKTIALSAFYLTSLPTTVAQKEIVQQMWDSGAHTIILIDHNNKDGFEAIANARELLLKKGSETEESEAVSPQLVGSHVLAPCPHNHPCPLLHSGGAPLICGFSQRIERPAFVRHTKHSKVGHEDVGYSYIVIQRGIRPAPVSTSVGRIGAIGKEVLESRRANKSVMEFHIQPEQKVEEILASVTEDKNNRLSLKSLQEKLRLEAYHWPRLVFPPLKKSGHIILDSCTSEGQIMRLTIPKSQGKQAFYDARKSSWGDIFPHSPKNPPLLRHQPKFRKRGQQEDTGGDIGKRKDSFKHHERPSYSSVADALRAKKKKSKREFAFTRGNKVWQD